MNVDDYGATGDGRDDTAAIERARAALAAAGGGRLRFTPGKTYAVTRINVTAGIDYQGFGATVKALRGTERELGVFVCRSASRAQVRGFRIDAGGFAQRAGFVSDSSDITFEWNYVFGFGTGTCRGGFRIGRGTEGCNVLHNTVIGPLDVPHRTIPQSFVGCFVFADPVDDYAGGNNPALAFPADPVRAPSRRHTIAGNRFYNGVHGINLFGASMCDVTGNWCVAGSERGIVLSPYAVGNTVRGNHCEQVTEAGIHLAWGSRFNIIEGNYVDATGTSTAERAGIQCYYGCVDNTIRGNVVRGTALFAYGCSIGSSRNIFAANRADGCGAGVYILNIHAEANGDDLPHLVPAQVPDADANIVTGNLITGCAEGVRVDACGTGQPGHGNTTNTTVSGNTVVGAVTPYAIREWSGAQVTGVTASLNTASATAGGGPAWTLARSEQHFAHTRALPVTALS